jgi:hypothetical protein
MSLRQGCTERRLPVQAAPQEVRQHRVKLYVIRQLRMTRGKADAHGVIKGSAQVGLSHAADDFVLLQEILVRAQERSRDHGTERRQEEQ